MKLIVQKETLDRLTKEELPLVGRTGRNYYSLDTLDVSLLAMTNEDIDKLRQAFRRVIEEDDDRHAPTLVRDIDQWFSVLNGEDAGGKRPRSLQQFSSLLTEYLRNVPGHRVYMRSPWSNGWLGYYVNTIDYHPPVKERDWYQPAYVTMDLLSYHLDKIEQTTITFKSEDTDRRTIARSLVDMGVLPETKDLRDAYLYYNEMYDNTFGKVGLQHQVYGFAMPMSESRRDRNNRVFMDVDGSPAKVVVDVVSEDGPRQDNNRDPIRRLFWASKVPSKAKAEDNRDELVGNVAIAEGREGENEAQEESAAIEIPVHPYVVVYDLERHKRFLVHVDDLEVYTFDTNLGDNLILPATTKDLIDTLVSQGRVSFRDIMEGRGSGACVLLGGPPGVGKSLSALVYAEATERPLLTVHAAQLGVDADDIEKNLTLYMRRASRWERGDAPRRGRRLHPRAQLRPATKRHRRCLPPRAREPHLDAVHDHQPPGYG